MSVCINNTVELIYAIRHKQWKSVKKIIGITVIFYSVFVFGVIGITTLYNFFSGTPEIKPIVYALLKGAEFVVLASVTVFLYTFRKKLRQNWTTISSFLILGTIFILSGIDASTMDELWNEYDFPALNIYTFPYVQPLDPFQHIVLFPMFLFKNSCQEGLIALKNKIRKKV